MNEYRWDDLTVGLKHSFDAAFTGEMVADFARLSGDINPLHVDAGYAVAAGFPSPVIFGMMSSSLYSKLVGVYIPGKYALLQGMDINFHHPTFVGDTLTCAGEIVFLGGAMRQMEIKASIRNQHGKLVSKALIRAGMHD
jgi:3-hydroxybutyryl-CoA dehydratase